MPSIIKQWLLRALGTLTICLPLNGQAQPYIANERGDQIWDKATNLVWQRCSVGQTWNGITCAGKTQELTFAQAKNLEGNGWRLPGIYELASLTYCSNGKPRSPLPQVGAGCDDGYSSPTINTTAFPGTRADPYWSSTANLKSSNDAWIVKWIVNFSMAYVYDRGPSSNEYNVRLVRVSKVVSDESGFAFWLGRPVPKQDEIAQDVWASGGEMEQSLGSVVLPWEPKSANSSPTLPSNVRPVDLQKMAANLKVLALAYNNQSPVVNMVSPPNMAEPVRQVIQPRQVSILPKGEFETTAAFEARKQQAYQEAQQADQAAKDSAEQAYQSAVRAFNAAKLEFKQQQAKVEADNAAARAQAEARKIDPNAYRSAVLKAWEFVANAHLHDPVLQDVAYDADREVFTAKLLSSRGLLVGDVVAPVPLARAPEFKADLLSGKIAPKVTFAYPSMRLDWVLIENSAQRSARFAAAQGSIDGLEALIREFPNAPETGEAKRRVQALIAQAFSSANTSSALQAVLNKYPSAEAAPAARKRVEQLRLAEQRAEREAEEARRREEREAQEAARRQREWENSPQGQAQRQQRQMCEAQKATCVASCPRQWSDTYKSYLNSPEYSCESRCQSVSCY